MIDDESRCSTQDRHWLNILFGEALGVDAVRVSEHARFNELGISSIQAVGLAEEIAQREGRQLPPTLLWDYPTLTDLRSYLEHGLAQTPQQQRAILGPEGEPIAIIGMSCRFPGNCTDPELFYYRLLAGLDAIGNYPVDRGSLDVYYDPDKSRPGTTNSLWGGYLDEVADFDGAFFSIAPLECVSMDPQQRLMLELAWECFEDAHQPVAHLRDRAVGVFIGAMWDDYARLQSGDPSNIVPHTATGLSLGIIASRVSYSFGLSGPSMVIDTACSSSLVAVHTACRSMRHGEAECCLAGGINLILAPDSTIAMAQFGGLSPDGRAKAFDARANGYVRGEGGGLVLLKPLRAALAAGDRIQALILGSAINNDGFSNGLTAPNPKAQERMLLDALADARCAPESVDYLETHGTGTKLGDPIEAGALGAVFAPSRQADAPLLLGSVKTQIGHLEAAAGVAGLIKAVLSLNRRLIPGNLHFLSPNSAIPFEDLRLEVVKANHAWPLKQPARAGISSFGFGGTNCHVIIGEAEPRRACLLAIEADDSAALIARADSMAEWLARAEQPLEAMALGMASRWQGKRWRAFAVAESHGEAAARLRASEPSQHQRQPIVFVFTGQGSQSWEMGSELYRSEPVFAQWIREVDRLAAAIAGFSPGAGMRGMTWDMSDPVAVQMTLFAIQVGLAELWRDWGIEPDAVVGHSLGEVAAAYVVGALELDQAVRLVWHRARLMRELDGEVAMEVVHASLSQIGPLLENEAKVSIACVNDHRTVVLSGHAEEVALATAKLRNLGLTTTAVTTNIPAHSHLLEPLLEPFAAAIEDLRHQPPGVPFFSSVVGRRLECLDAAYWCRNLRETVRFDQAVDALLAAGYRAFVQIGPHDLHGLSLRHQLEAQGLVGKVWSSLKRGERERRFLLETAAGLAAEGQALALGRSFDCALRPQIPSELNAEPLLPAAPRRAGLLMISARSRDALRQRVAALVPDAERAADDLAHALAQGYDHHELRLAVPYAAGTRPEKALRAFLAGQTGGDLIAGAVPTVAPRVAFVFPGQGAQWLGMGRGLYRYEQVFRAQIQACERAIAAHGGFSVIEQLFASPECARLDEVAVVQPLIFALQTALAELWRSWGVEPAAVVGHSMGEVAAAYVAGALSLDDAALVICARSRLVRERAELGAMALIDMGPSALSAELSAYPGLAIAAINGPSALLVSGVPREMDELLANLESRGIFCRRILVDYASHCAQMDALLEPLRQRLTGVTARAGQVPMHSTVDNHVIDGSACNADYWARNLRQPVMFHDRIAAMAERGINVFIEINAHPAMTLSLRSTLEVLGRDALLLSSLRRDEDDCLAMMRNLGQLYAAGGLLQPQRLFRFGRPLRLPHYPWQRQRHWPKARHTSTPAQAHHPFVGERFDAPLEELVYSATLALEDHAWLADHRVGGHVLLPATAMLETMWSAVAGARGTTCALLDWVIEQAFEVKPGLVYELRTLVAAESARFFGRERGKQQWICHASCRIGKRTEPRLPTFGLGEAQVVGAFYARQRERGYEYGPAFRGMTRLALDGDWVELAAKLPAACSSDERYACHPALLDACLQGYLALIDDDKERPLPLAIDRFQLWDTPGERLVARLHRSADGGSFQYFLFDAEERLVGLIDGLTVRVEPVRDGVLMVPQWRPRPRTPAASVSGHWFLIAGTGDPVGEYGAHLAQRGLQVTVLRPPGASLAAGERVLPEPADLVDLLCHHQARGLIDRRALCLSDTVDFESESDLECLLQQLLALVQKLADKLLPSGFRWYMLTRGAIVTSPDQEPAPFQAALRGWAKSLALEHADWFGGLVDLDPLDEEQRSAELMVEVMASEPCAELALRDGRAHVGTLVAHYGEAPLALTLPPDNFFLVPGERGFFEKLEVHHAEQESPGPGQVALVVEAAGLNFRDVMNCLGTYPGDAGALGLECAGTVIAVGDGVEDLAPGDRVMALGGGCFGSRLVCDRRLCQVVPARVTAEEAAGVPVVFLTAEIALVALARLAAGEILLLHSAAGGVGLAALQVARRLGARVFATASSEEKRRFLLSHGAERVFHSRDTAYGEAIMAATAGRGVDVVLNSLAAPHIQTSLSVLAEGGRFVEIGKTGILERAAAERAAHGHLKGYWTYDLLEHAARAPHEVGEVLARIAQALNEGRYRPLPTLPFPMARVASAMQAMSRGRHIGKFVLSRAHVDALFAFRRHGGAVLITGGLGGLGLLTAELLAAQGVRHLILQSRKGQLNPLRLDRIHALGAEVQVVNCDVTDYEAMERMLSEVERRVAVRGVVHAAGVLCDGLAMYQSWSDFSRALLPKLRGAVVLEKLCAWRNLDLLVCFSSVGSWAGMSGQVSYACANAFLDAWSERRRRRGQAGLSIAWGTWEGVGMLVNDHQGLEAWKQRGIGALDVATGGALLLEALHAEKGYLVAYKPLVAQQSEVVAVEAAVLESDREAVFGSGDPEHLRGWLRARVLETLRAVLSFNSDREIPGGRGFRELGMDSMMTVVFRNRLQRDLELALPATLAFNYPNLDSLTQYLFELLLPVPEEKPLENNACDQFDGLTDQDLLSLLDAELSELQRNGL